MVMRFVEMLASRHTPPPPPPFSLVHSFLSSVGVEIIIVVKVRVGGDVLDYIPLSLVPTSSPAPPPLLHSKNLQKSERNII
jgi:hypothetical protein